MDAFFAAVEQRDFPQYRDKPLIVGGSPDKRGVVATCSYEARQFGIHSAMPSSRAVKLCPQAIFVRPRFDAYVAVSEQIRGIFSLYTDQIEPLSLDEAYLDVSDCSLFKGSATLIARDIKQQIHQTTGLTASAGVSYNKFLAKIASDMDKPDGLTVIRPEQGEAFVATLPIGKFYGVGKATEARMKALGIHNGADLKKLKLEQLAQYFGQSAEYFYQIARGIDERPVISERIRKSLGSETTFEHDLDDIDDMRQYLNKLAIDVADDLAARELHGQTLTLKVKYDDFEQVTRSKTLAHVIQGAGDMMPVIDDLLKKTDVQHRNVRLLGITVSNFIDPDNFIEQPDLFE